MPSTNDSDISRRHYTEQIDLPTDTIDANLYSVQAPGTVRSKQ